MLQDSWLPSWFQVQWKELSAVNRVFKMSTKKTWSCSNFAYGVSDFLMVFVGRIHKYIFRTITKKKKKDPILNAGKDNRFNLKPGTSLFLKLFNIIYNIGTR